MLKLKNVLLKAGSKQSELAKALNLSQATVAQIVNHGEWPKSLDQVELQALDPYRFRQVEMANTRVPMRNAGELTLIRSFRL